MLAFAVLARAQGADVVSLQFFGIAEVSTSLHRAGFAVRGENALVYVGHASPAVAAVDPTTRWYSTGFDNDAD